MVTLLLRSESEKGWTCQLGKEGRSEENDATQKNRNSHEDVFDDVLHSWIFTDRSYRYSMRSVTHEVVDKDVGSAEKAMRKETVSLSSSSSRRVLSQELPS